MVSVSSTLLPLLHTPLAPTVPNVDNEPPVVMDNSASTAACVVIIDPAFPARSVAWSNTNVSSSPAPVPTWPPAFDTTTDTMAGAVVNVPVMSTGPRVAPTDVRRTSRRSADPRISKRVNPATAVPPVDPPEMVIVSVSSCSVPVLH